MPGQVYTAVYIRLQNVKRRVDTGPTPSAPSTRPPWPGSRAIRAAQAVRPASWPCIASPNPYCRTTSMTFFSASAGTRQDSAPALLSCRPPALPEDRTGTLFAICAPLFSIRSAELALLAKRPPKQSPQNRLPMGRQHGKKGECGGYCGRCSLKRRRLPCPAPPKHRASCSYIV